MAAQDSDVSTESNASALVATASAFLSLAWLSVRLRTYVRAIMLKRFQADDWFMLVAQLNYTISCGFILRGVHFGMGRHNKALNQSDEINALEYQALATATYIANMMFIKLSIAIFLLRIAPQKSYKWAIHGSIAVVVVWSIVLFFWNIFQCHPVEAQWDYTILQKDKNASCVTADQIVNAAYALSVMTVLSDWFYALIPIPMVWNVKMTKQAKATVMVVLGLGVFASVATLIRLKFLADLTELDDLLYATTDAMVWTLIEPGVAIIAASLVTTRPLLHAMRVRGFHTTGNSKRTFPSNYEQPGSRPKRSGSMPGFGSRDIASLKDPEAGYGNYSRTNSSPEYGTTTKIAYVPTTVDERPEAEDADAQIGRNGIHRRVEVHSEMYVIEVPTPEPQGHYQYQNRAAWLEAGRDSSEVELAPIKPVYTPQHERNISLASSPGYSYHDRKVSLSTSPTHSQRGRNSSQASSMMYSPQERRVSLSTSPTYTPHDRKSSLSSSPKYSNGPFGR